MHPLIPFENITGEKYHVKPDFAALFAWTEKGNSTFTRNPFTECMQPIAHSS